MKIIKKFNSIKKAYESNSLKEGLIVKTNGNTFFADKKEIKGIIGEIDTENERMFIWHNNSEKAGSEGKKNPKNHGYKYSWMVDLDNRIAKIEIENEVKEFSQNQKLNNLEATLKYIK